MRKVGSIFGLNPVDAEIRDMLYIHKTNQLLIYCESINPKIKSKIINLDANKNHKPTLFLEKFNAAPDSALGNII